MNKFIPVFMAVITALLYVIGITYYESFLLAFGLDKSQFPLSFDLMLFKGFVSTVMLGIKGLIYFYLSAIGVVLIAIAGRIISNLIRDHKLLNYLRSKLKTNDGFTIQENSFTEFSIKVFELISGLIIIFILVIVLIFLSEKAGKESANRFVEKCEEKPIIKTTVKIKGEEKPFTGCTIACNSNQCAYQGTSRVVIINKDRTLFSEIQK